MILRWGIETSFNHLKNAIHVEEFVGIKENSIKQEFYATLLKYNLFMLFIDEAAMVSPTIKKTLKFEYKVNIRKATAILSSNILKLLFEKQNKVLNFINKFVKIIADFKSVVKPDRHFKRRFNSCKHSVFYRKNIVVGLS